MGIAAHSSSIIPSLLAPSSPLPPFFLFFSSSLLLFLSSFLFSSSILSPQLSLSALSALSALSLSQSSFLNWYCHTPFSKLPTRQSVAKTPASQLLKVSCTSNPHCPFLPSPHPPVNQRLHTDWYKPNSQLNGAVLNKSSSRQPQFQKKEGKKKKKDHRGARREKKKTKPLFN